MLKSNYDTNVILFLYYFSSGINSFTSLASHWMYMKAYAMGLSNVWFSKWIDESESFTDFTASFWDGVSGKYVCWKVALVAWMRNISKMKYLRESQPIFPFIDWELKVYMTCDPYRYIEVSTYEILRIVVISQFHIV